MTTDGFFFFFPFPKSCLYDGQLHVEEICKAEMKLVDGGSKGTQQFYCRSRSWLFVLCVLFSVCHASHIEGIIAARRNEERPQQFVCNLI